MSTWGRKSPENVNYEDFLAGVNTIIGIEDALARNDRNVSSDVRRYPNYSSARYAIDSFTDPSNPNATANADMVQLYLASLNAEQLEKYNKYIAARRFGGRRTRHRSKRNRSRKNKRGSRKSKKRQ